uniref:Uncharacterized protein LOC105045765 isoform X1 n=1 Tax=Elaeis guineensis var. tenera TaxID=51953 RepID=A0A6I9RAA1_ELAGV|nr:uncharacterized protein LOC105045765 isoform X1 [Elaeis guineensis]
MLRRKASLQRLNICIVGHRQLEEGESSKNEVKGVTKKIWKEILRDDLHEDSFHRGLGCGGKDTSHWLLKAVLKLIRAFEDGDNQEQFLFFAGNWLWCLHCPELQCSRYQKAGEYMAVCGKAH